MQNNRGATQGSRAHIFLVENDYSLSGALQKKLKKEGYQVTLFEDGINVKERALEDQPDLILLDIQLPIVDGLEVLSNLKKDENTKAIPVIMLTNLDLTSPKMLRTTNQYPPNLYLVKSSWTLSALLDQIKDTLKN